MSLHDTYILFINQPAPPFSESFWRVPFVIRALVAAAIGADIVMATAGNATNAHPPRLA